MKKAITLCLVMLSILMHGQNIELDLSKNVDNIFKTTVPSNTELKVTIKNRLPNPQYDYSIQIIKSNIPIETLTLPKKTTTAESNILLKKCNLSDKINAINEVESEKDLSQEIAKIEQLFKKFIDEIKNGDGDCSLDEIDQAKSLIKNKTTQSIWTGRLNKGEQLSITVSRKIDSVKTSEWNFVLTTEKRGEWQVSYGFSFNSQIFNKEKKYYSKPTEVTGEDDATITKYTITPQNSRSELSFAPSIFFSWYPTSRQNKTLHVGASGGLGYDFESPTVFLAAVLSFNQNLKFHLGLVTHQQKTLFGRYSSGDIINDPLEEAQLHEDKYQINPFFSLSFRFGDSPFSQKSGE